MLRHLDDKQNIFISLLANEKSQRSEFFLTYPNSHKEYSSRTIENSK